MKRGAAVFTIVQNEPVFLTVWSRYYQRYFSREDMFVLDHESTDAGTLAVAQELHRVPVHRAESFNHRWLRDTVVHFQAFLLQSYEQVLFVEVDEIVAMDPRTGEHAGVRLLDQVFGILAGTGERPSGPVEPVEVVSEPGGVKRALHP